MNFKKIISTVAAAAVAISAMAVSVFAAQSETIAAVKLDSSSEDAKIMQWPISAFADITSVDTITIKGTGAVDGWCGGGGAIGFDSADGWKQVDFALDGANVTLDSATGEFSAECDFGGAAPDLGKADGIIQIGWWWGSGDGTMQLNDLLVNGTSVLGKTGTFPAAEEETAEDTAEAVEDTAEDVAEDTAEGVVDDAAEDDAADVADDTADVADDAAEDVTVDNTSVDTTADSTTTPAATGNASAAVILSVMAVAGAAAVVAKKRK